MTVRGLIESAGRISKLYLIIATGIWVNTIVSCASAPKTLDPQLAPYKYRFIKMTKYTEDHFQFYDIKFESLPGTTVGVCNELWRSIKIDPTYWNRSSQKEKEAVIFHELAHCICHIDDHTKEVRQDGCPVSLMHKSIPDLMCLNAHWNDYIAELMGRCQ